MGHTASLHQTPSNEGSVRSIPIHQDKGYFDVSGAHAEVVVDLALPDHMVSHRLADILPSLKMVGDLNYPLECGWEPLINVAVMGGMCKGGVAYLDATKLQ